ncbi:MAG: hypothetical protein RLZZ522_637 [Verrucomicrobiota bacterium]
MHNYCKTIGALAAVSALVAGNAAAEVDYELTTGYSNEYLFRGLNLGQDLIEVSADVKAKLADGWAVSAYAWYGNVNNGHVFGMNDQSFNELDLYADVSKEFSFATATLGYINRSYDTDAMSPGPLGYFDVTQEISLGMSRQFYGIDTSLTYYWGIEGDNDGYTELAMNKAWELKPCLVLNTGGQLGYLMEQGQCTALTLKTSLDWGFAGTAKLSPFMAYALSLSDPTTVPYNGNKDQFVGGVMLSVGF